MHDRMMANYCVLRRASFIYSEMLEFC